MRAIQMRSRVAHIVGLTLLLLAGAPQADAQIRQRCLALNEGGPGIEYLRAANDADFEGNNTYTIEAWVHPTIFDGFSTILGNNYTDSFWLGLNSAGNIRWYPRGANLGGFIESVATVPLNEWTHVAVTYDSAVGYWIYVNGQLVSAGNSILGVVGMSVDPVRIGADYSLGLPAYFFNGYLDEIRYWDVPRTGPEIQSTMRVGVGRPSSFTNGLYDGLVANWPNNDTVLSGSVDLAGTSNFASFINGDVTTHTSYTAYISPPVVPGVALQLNGIDDYVKLPVSEDFDRGLTLMAWIAPTSFVGFPTIVGRNYQTSFWFGLSTTGHLRFYPTGGAGNYVESPDPVLLDRWTHVAATYSSGHILLYVNGRPVLHSTAITGPVGANGDDVWIGADREAGFRSYEFTGYLDEVKVVQGVLDAPQIRHWMLLGNADDTNPFPVVDLVGEAVDMYYVTFDEAQQLTIEGTGAQLVRTGSPALHAEMFASGYGIESFSNLYFGGFALPDDDVVTGVGSDVYVPLDAPITGTRVFVASAITDLSTAEVEIRSPMGTWVLLLAAGDAVGRDLLTVIEDGSSWTWASSANPYASGVQPSNPLSVLNGEPAMGLWRLEIINTNVAETVGLWAWGVEVNNTNVAVALPEGAEARLQLAGPNPVRGSGALSFSLGEAATVELGLFDLQGRHVLSLVDGRRDAGSYQVSFSSAGLEPGVYLARLQVDGAERGLVKLSVVR